MKFLTYLEEKITFIIFQITFMFLTFLFLYFLNVPKLFIVLMIAVLTLYTLIFLIIDYLYKKRKYNKIIELTDLLEEKYYISEVIPKPTGLENKAYKYALKEACKGMNDRLGKLERESTDFEEYVESFAHEIKTPIAALSLSFDNTDNITLKNEVKKIDDLVEQMLFYARSDSTEKDYFVKEVSLSDIIHVAVLNYKDYLLNKKISLDIHDLERIVYTDEKWLSFILAQIIQNSIKYLDKKEKKIEIYSEENKNNVVLTISDNGVGIKDFDLKRIYEKGFTGTNRKKEHSTGMGLYLSKKLCDRLGLKIEIESEENKYTKVILIFPKSHIHRLGNN